MISSLKYDVTFARTGRTLQRGLTFGQGLTLITGPNESGKTFAIEMIRFCLFGSAALRGVAADYAKLSAELVFTVRDVSYRVERSLTGAKLSIADDPEGVLATGTRPVNGRLLTMFGYDLSVFDVANVLRQGEGSRLSNMTPADRKRMVDRLVGADKLEEVSTWCRQQARERDLVGKTIERGLTPPAQPVPIEGETDLTVLGEELQTVERLENFLQQIEFDLARLVPPPPAGVKIPTDAELEDYQRRLVEKERLEKLPLIDFDRDQLRQAWDAYDAGQRVAMLGPRPEATIEELEILNKEWLDWTHQCEVRRQLERLYEAPTGACECGKTFSIAQNDIDELETKLDLSMPEPSKSIEWIRRQERAHVAWANACEGDPDVPRPDRARHLLNVVGRQPGELESVAHYSRSELSKMGDLRRAAADDIRREMFVANRTELLAELNNRSSTQIREQIFLVDEYRRRMDRYDRDLAEYEKRRTSVDEALTEAEDWGRARAAIDALRQEVKLHLVPSLARVASRLLSQLTGGARSLIEISEDFEITVDGQPIHTLSGSGVDCANIALRLALGQVLTNNVFSVLILDEADTAMDSGRAENLQSTLNILAENISQIILVTHKIPRTEHVIAM